MSANLLSNDFAGLEDIRWSSEKCVRCNMCKFPPLARVESRAHSMGCPAYEAFKFNANSGGGMVIMANSLLAGRSEVTGRRSRRRLRLHPVRAVRRELQVQHGHRSARDALPAAAAAARRGRNLRRPPRRAGEHPRARPPLPGARGDIESAAAGPEYGRCRHVGVGGAPLLLLDLRSAGTGPATDAGPARHRRAVRYQLLRESRAVQRTRGARDRRPRTVPPPVDGCRGGHPFQRGEEGHVHCRPRTTARCARRLRSSPKSARGWSTSRKPTRISSPGGACGRSGPCATRSSPGTTPATSAAWEGATSAVAGNAEEGRRDEGLRAPQADRLRLRRRVRRAPKGAGGASATCRRWSSIGAGSTPSTPARPVRRPPPWPDFAAETADRRVQEALGTAALPDHRHRMPASPRQLDASGEAHRGDRSAIADRTRRRVAGKGDPS